MNTLINVVIIILLFIFIILYSLYRFNIILDINIKYNNNKKYINIVLRIGRIKINIKNYKGNKVVGLLKLYKKNNILIDDLIKCIYIDKLNVLLSSSFIINHPFIYLYTYYIYSVIQSITRKKVRIIEQSYFRVMPNISNVLRTSVIIRVKLFEVIKVIIYNKVKTINFINYIKKAKVINYE